MLFVDLITCMCFWLHYHGVLTGAFVTYTLQSLTHEPWQDAYLSLFDFPLFHRLIIQSIPTSQAPQIDRQRSA